MVTSFIRMLKNIHNMKAPKFFAIVSLLILTTGSAFGQVPVWTATYPSLSNISALNAVLNVNLTNLPGDVTVYFTVYSILAGDTPAGVKAASGNLPSGAFRGGGSFTYTTGNSGTTISQFFENLFPSKPTNTILITVEYAPNVFLPVKTIVFATPACANLNVATSRFEPVECVNKGVTFTLSIPGVDPDPQISGVYKGTTWDINWGDGTADMLYTSTANSDFPNNALRTHPYPAITSCVYTITLNIQSPAPCSKFFTVKYQVFVHGRDIPGDGDGVLLIQENLTGLTTTIPVCEGSTHTITLKDMSTWNCQNPVLGGLPWPPAKNTSDRTIQWLYGIDNGGVLQNTIGQTLGITPNVVIGGVNNAIRTIQGYTQPVIAPAAYQGELSQTILIPATCRAGEIFNVYLRNWNKCNVYGVDLTVFTQIQIMVVAAPAAPIA